MRVVTGPRCRLAPWLVVLGLGCGAASDHATVVEFWALGREGEVVKQLVPEFERRHPGLRVRLQQIPWGAAHEKLLTAYVGGAMPDVVQVGNTWIPELVALGALEPLDPWIATSATVSPSDYFEGILDTNVIDGTTFALPWYVDTRLLFYRTDLLASAGYAEPPRTWQSWVDAMARVKAQGGVDRHAVLLPLGEWQTPVILALQEDAVLLRDQEQYGNFRSERFRAAFGFYLDLFRRGLAPRTGLVQAENVYQDFASGLFCFYVSGPWNVGEFGRRLPARVQGAWSTAPMPAPTERYPGTSIAGGASLAILKTSGHKEAAWGWVEYLADPRRQLEFHRLTGDLPARRSAWTAESLAEDRYARAFWLQLRHVRSTPKIPEWERIASKIAQYAEAAVRGSMTADAALDALDDDVDRILEKRRWLLRRQAAPSGSP